MDVALSRLLLSTNNIFTDTQCQGLLVSWETITKVWECMFTKHLSPELVSYFHGWVTLDKTIALLSLLYDYNPSTTPGAWAFTRSCFTVHILRIVLLYILKIFEIYSSFKISLRYFLCRIILLYVEVSFQAKLLIHHRLHTT